jgi:uncharacterized protein (DUF934 family)
VNALSSRETRAVAIASPAVTPLLRADGTWLGDTARIVRSAGAADVAAGDVVPLAFYLSLADPQRDGLGIWLAPTDEPGELAPYLAALALVAVDFPSFRDGRSYSTAALLRGRYHFRGDLRAIGDVLVDQLFYLRRVGFTSFELRADQDPAVALAALRTFSDAYQASVDQPLPHFRRRAAPAGATR